MSYRDGGPLRSTSSHIAIVSTCFRSDLTKPIGLREVFLLVDEPESAFDYSNIPCSSEYLLLQTECLEAMTSTKGEIPLNGTASQLIARFAEQTIGTSTVRTVLKIALIYAVLDSKRIVDGSHVAAGIDLVCDSNRVLQSVDTRLDIDRREVMRKIVEDALETRPRLTGKEMNRLFSGNVDRKLLDGVKQDLIQRERARVSFERGKGRPKEIWTRVLKDANADE